MSIRDCSSTVTAYGEVWRDSFDQRHSGRDQFSVSDSVNQHCFGPADGGLISGTTNDSQGLYRCSMGKGNSRIISLLYCSYT